MNIEKLVNRVHKHDHCDDFDNAVIVTKTKCYRKSLFLEALIFRKDHLNSENDHKEKPIVYKSLT